jgi:hypothetical protein
MMVLDKIGSVVVAVGQDLLKISDGMKRSKSKDPSVVEEAVKEARKDEEELSPLLEIGVSIIAGAIVAVIVVATIVMVVDPSRDR